MLLHGDENLDDELMRRLGSRDPGALEAIYDRYGRIVYSMFFKVTRNQSTAEDLTQDLFLRLWNRAANFDGSRGSAATWILSVTRNMGIDYLRSGHAQWLLRMEPVDGVYMDHRQRDPGKGYETVLNNCSLVGRSLHRLALNQRHVLELAYYEGFSQTEIAERLEVPLGTVKSWARAGLQSLREILQLAS